MCSVYDYCTAHGHMVNYSIKCEFTTNNLQKNLLLDFGQSILTLEILVKARIARFFFGLFSFLASSLEPVVNLNTASLLWIIDETDQDLMLEDNWFWRIGHLRFDYICNLPCVECVVVLSAL